MYFLVPILTVCIAQGHIRVNSGFLKIFVIPKDKGGVIHLSSCFNGHPRARVRHGKIGHWSQEKISGQTDGIAHIRGTKERPTKIDTFPDPINPHGLPQVFLLGRQTELIFGRIGQTGNAQGGIDHKTGGFDPTVRNFPLQEIVHNPNRSQKIFKKTPHTHPHVFGDKIRISLGCRLNHPKIKFVVKIKKPTVDRLQRIRGQTDITLFPKSQIIVNRHILPKGHGHRPQPNCQTTEAYSAQLTGKTVTIFHGHPL